MPQCNIEWDSSQSTLALPKEDNEQSAFLSLRIASLVHTNQPDIACIVELLSFLSIVDEEIWIPGYN